MAVEDIFGCMMIFMRAIGLVVQLPVLAGRPIPVVVRLAIAFFLAVLLAGAVPVAAIPGDTWTLCAAAAVEVIVGLALGFIVRMAFAATEMAGRIIATEIGLNASPGMGVPEPSAEPVAALLSAFAIVLFFLFRGHEAMLSAFAQSFQLAAAGGAGFSAHAPEALVNATGHVIELGLRIAAPFIAMNFLVTLAFAVLGRAVPKMHVFIVSFSGKALLGLTLLSGAGALIAPYLFSEFAELPFRMLELLR